MSTVISNAKEMAEQARAFDRAVARATLAPSVHNTQPWRFVQCATGLEILADRARQLPVLDPTGRHLYLSLGCALFNARVSLAASGGAIEVVRHPNENRPDLVARIAIRTASDRGSGHGDPGSGQTDVDHELAVLDPSIRIRQTNRRRFTDTAVPADLIATLAAAAAAEGAMLMPVTDPGDRHSLAELWQQADLLQITDPAYRAELRAWTTSDPGRRDGVAARTAPHVGDASGDELPIRDFDTDGVGWLPTATHSTEDQCLLLLGSEQDDPAAWLRSGEALERVWLELTRAGYVASLFTQAIEVAPLRIQLRQRLRLPVYPHVLLRVGRADLTAASSRRLLRGTYFTDIDA